MPVNMDPLKKRRRPQTAATSAAEESARTPHRPHRDKHLEKKRKPIVKRIWLMPS